ncbi:alpha/beta hydrolase [Mycobacterium sp. 852013-50091_SCH5140682]|uniref:alpha/beta fold hydrolase n=1 Tax=Mycobacterium sp. 852013-50091_SCH5140682 TaxID=1834109 RepID=UPI0007EA9C03|nr:alpha/beta hydrolase [Mycobacterium sp. 852013-50091_SCH5140682]OBC01893.1 alpha/beta hydrolase [Mycobacterium sp. 852013-50091_SCH5140682]
MSVAPEPLVPTVFGPAAARDDGCVERTVTTKDGVRLAVSDYPAERADAPTIVLLHGLLLSQESWGLQVGELRRRYGGRIRVITYDHRGHGRSADAPMPTYEITQLAADLAEVLAAVHITGPLTLAGHSMGGMTALAYFGRAASQRPVEPAGLVLVGTAAGSIAERGIGRLLATPATGALFGLVHRMPQRATDKAVQALIRPLGEALSRFSGEGTMAGVVAAAVGVAALRTASLTTAAGFLPSLKRYDVYHALKSIAAKTFVVSGGTDVLTPPSHSRDLAAAIPGALHLHHPTAGHMLLQDAAECVTDAIGRAMGMRRGSRRPARVRGSGNRSAAAQLAVVVS